MTIQDLANNPISPGTTGQMLGYVEPTAPEEVLPLRMYNFLLYPIRQADSTREGAYFVKRLFEGPQAVWQKTQEKIFALKDLWSVTKCPDEALKYLKNIVGWTPDLEYITDELDYDTLRRLIAASVPLWRRRGREETTLNVLTLVANARCVIWNWFDYRWIIDETEFSENHQGRDSWMVGDGSGLGEYESALRIVDDGTLNRTLVKNVTKFMRACGERIEIAYIDFLDRFLVESDNSQWSALQGAVSVIEDGEAKLEVLATQQIAVADTDNSPVWTDYVAYLRLQGAGAAKFGAVFYVQDVDNYYGFRLHVGQTYDYELFKVMGGTRETLIEGNLLYNLSEDVWYGVRVQIQQAPIGNYVKVYLDADKIIDTIDSSEVVWVSHDETNKATARSTNYGVSFSTSEDFPDTYCLSAKNFDNGIILGATYNTNKIVRSADYGMTWQSTFITLDGYPVQDFAMLPDGVGIAGDGATNTHGRIYRTDDWGQSWIDVKNIGSSVNGVGAFGNNQGIMLACNYEREIWRSLDYGKTWTLVYTGARRMFGAAALSNGVGIVCSIPDTIYRTTDYGANWTPVVVPLVDAFYQVDGWENGVMLAGGRDGDEYATIWRSDDYGATWSVAYNDPNGMDITDFALQSDGIGIAVTGGSGGGSFGRILRTANYGVTWSAVESRTNTYYYSAAMFKGTLGRTTKGTFGFFAEDDSTVKLSECELFQLPLDTDLIDINS